MTPRHALLALLPALACGDPPAATIDAAPFPPTIDATAVPPAIDAAPQDAAPADADPGLPDLTVVESRLVVDLSIEQASFAEDACELAPVEACVGAPGLRRLLRFSVETPNVGTGDLFLGAPSPDNPLYQWSECHEHYHFEGFATYSLVDDSGEVVAPGHKQAFCLLDWHRVVLDDPTVASESRYHCAYQGIQRGWSDVYEARLPCQFVDITGVPNGDYTLRVELNPARTLEELSYDNNLLELPVRLDDADLQQPTEACPDGVDGLFANGKARECGWDFRGTWECEPGAVFRIGCAEACAGLGACTGNPMLRVCDAAAEDGNCSATNRMEDNDDACGSACPRVRNQTCPASGQLAVYTAPFAVGEPYSCEIALAYD